jgi:hypothetical protein
MIVQVRAHRRVASRDAVEAVFDGSTGPVIDILEYDLADVSVFDEPSGERRVTLDVPITQGSADVDRLDLLEPGVYPVTVQIRRDGALIASHTTFVELVRTNGIGLGPFTYAVLATIEHPGPAPSDDEIAAARAHLDRLTDLVATIDAPVSAAIPPVFDDVLLDGEVGDRLRSALGDDDVVVVLPATGLDPSAAADAGLLGDLDRSFDDAEARLARVLPGVTLDRTVWPVGSQLTTAGAEALRDLGAARLLVVPFDQYVELDGSLPDLTDTSLLLSTALPGPAVIPIPMAVVDPVDELLDPDRNTTTTPATEAVRLIATTSAMRFQLGPDLRAFVLTTPELGIPDPAVLQHLEQFVAEHGDYTFAPIGQLPDVANSFFVDGVQASVALPDTATVSIADRADAVAGVRLRMADVGSMLTDDDASVDAWDARLHTALAPQLSEAEAGGRITAVDAEIATVRAAVLPPETFSFTVTGRDTDIPLRVENTGNRPLSVTVHVEAEKLNVLDPDLEVVLAPNAITDVPVPVSPRSNGVFPVVVELRTPAGNQLTDPVELTARVSTLTGLGRVFTVGALLVLASWWFSWFRRRHRAEQARSRAAAQERHPSAVPLAELSPDAAEALVAEPTPQREQ